MKTSKLRTSREPRLMIIPMIDIIFFLLVFFMMSTLYMVEQKTIPLQLPQATTQQITRDKSIAITVLSDGKIMFDQEEVPAKLLQRRIQVELKSNVNTAFILRSDRKTEYQYIVTVIDELKAAGVKRLSIATERKAE